MLVELRHKKLWRWFVKDYVLNSVTWFCHHTYRPKRHRCCSERFGFKVHQQLMFLFLVRWCVAAHVTSERQQSSGCVNCFLVRAKSLTLGNSALFPKVRNTFTPSEGGGGGSGGRVARPLIPGSIRAATCTIIETFGLKCCIQLLSNCLWDAQNWKTLNGHLGCWELKLSKIALALLWQWFFNHISWSKHQASTHMSWIM